MGAQTRSARARSMFMLLGGHRFAIAGRFPDATIGVAYDETINLTGPYSAPVVVDALEGASALPPGLTLEIDATGTKARLHGTPLGDLEISGALPAAHVGIAYSARLPVSNASGLVTVDISEGTMPEWMSASWHSDTQEIEFYGTPT